MSALLATFGIDWHLLLAQSINFIVLVIALTYFLYKPVLKMVRERERVVAKGVDDAREAAEQLAHAGTAAALVVSKADKEAEAIVKAARAEGTQERAKMLADAEARAAQVARDAEARAIETAARARRESEKDIARVAILAAEKVLQKQS
jgi:F-type H+-transporting ATPase subunit b